MASFRFLPPAEVEPLQQISYYAYMRTELGVKFEEAVAEAVTRAAEHPEHGAPISMNTRRRLVSGFPFGFIYTTLADGILVIATSDGRRPPEYWADRVQ